jgi:hypothetical protein
MLIPALLFSLVPLVASGGRAWEYDPVRELFIAGVVIFLLLVVLPLVARYGTLRNRKWAKASAVAAGAGAALVGALFLISALSIGMAGGFIIPVIFFGLSASVFWLLHRTRAV